MQLSRKIYKAYQKAKKDDMGKTKQTTEPHMVRTPIIRTRFKTTVFNMLILLMDKVDSIQYQLESWKSQERIKKKY